MTWAFRGLIEGFYGPPWSWDDRARVMEWCHRRGMTHYLYAPKDDPLHRDRWREPYPDDELARFRALVEQDTLALGFAISPGLSIDYDDPADRDALAAKVGQLTALGVGLVCLALDDIPVRAGLGGDHARLATWLRDELADDIELVVVPTEYTGTAPTPYLDALAAGLPEGVLVAWTGRTVVCDTISVADAQARAAALGDRPPLVWDNYPVNDALMADQLFLGPLRGRAPDLGAACSGYVANPMVQPLASRLPLSSTAAYLLGDDPVEAWQADADGLGLRAFAEACDGTVPRRLVRAVATTSGAERDGHLDDLRTWLDELRERPPLEEDAATEIQPWLDQCSQEVSVMLVAVRLLRALRSDDVAAATEQGLALLYAWPQVRRGERAVMGSRCSVRPVLGQWPDGSWSYDRGSVTEDDNATDALVRVALNELADAGPVTRSPA